MSRRTQQQVTRFLQASNWLKSFNLNSWRRTSKRRDEFVTGFYIVQTQIDMHQGKSDADLALSFFCAQNIRFLFLLLIN